MKNGMKKIAEKAVKGHEKRMHGMKKGGKVGKMNMERKRVACTAPATSAPRRPATTSSNSAATSRSPTPPEEGARLPYSGAINMSSRLFGGGGLSGQPGRRQEAGLWPVRESALEARRQTDCC